MIRFHHLIKKQIESGAASYRQIAKQTGLPATSIIDYHQNLTEPRMKALVRIANYFHEPVQTMLLEMEDPAQDDQNNYDVQMYCYWDLMTETEKQQTLAFIRSIRKVQP